MSNILLSSLVAMLVAAPAAQAHQIWFEQDGKAVKLQFGEFALNQRETTPGLLDKFGAPSATLLGAKGERALKLDKTAKGYLVSGATPAAGDALVAQDNAYPSWETDEAGKKLNHIWVPAARMATSFAAQQPTLTLDLVPTGKAGEFKVFYKGQPLPKAKVNAIVQSGWAKEAESDDSGVVKFDMPWKGLYVLETEHTDKTAGERAGLQYATSSYTTSLSVVQPKGIAAVAAGPAMAPSADH